MDELIRRDPLVWVMGVPKETGWYWVAPELGAGFYRMVHFFNGQDWHIGAGRMRSADWCQAYIGPLEEPQVRL